MGFRGKLCLLSALLVFGASGSAWASDAPKPVFALKVSEGQPPVVQDEGSWSMPVEIVPGEGPEPSFTATSSGGYLSFPEGSRAGVVLKDSEMVNTLSGPFTVALWLRPGSIEKRFGELVCAAGDGGPAQSFRLRFSGHSKALHFSSGGLNPSLSVNTKAGTVPLNAWTHVAAVSDGTQVMIFVNGTQAVETAVSGVDLAPQLGKGRFLTLGNYIGRKDSYAFVGDLAGVSIYDRALDASQIGELAGKQPD